MGPRFATGRRPSAPPAFEQRVFPLRKVKSEAGPELVVHPSLRGLNLDPKELESKGLALPTMPRASSEAGSAATAEPPDSDTSKYSEHNSPSKPGPAEPGKLVFQLPAATGSTEDLVPFPLRVKKSRPRNQHGDLPHGNVAEATTPAALRGLPNVTTSPSLDKTVPGSNTLSRLRSGWKSAENLFSKFQGQEQVPSLPGRTPSIGRGNPFRAAATKKVRFSDEDPVAPMPAKKSFLQFLQSTKVETEPWLYVRAYEMEKAAAEREGRECRLPPPEKRWLWSADETAFSIRPKTPKAETQKARTGVPEFIEEMETTVDELRKV